MERIYNVPLKLGWLKVPRWRRAEKAVKFLREFAKRHMKGEEVVIDPEVNKIIWSRGAKNPPRKIRVLMEKKENIVYVKLPEVRRHEVSGEGRVQAEEKSMAEVSEGGRGEERGGSETQGNVSDRGESQSEEVSYKDTGGKEA